jgi:hypothetical protein
MLTPKSDTQSYQISQCSTADDSMLVTTRTLRGSGAYWHNRGVSAVLPTKQRLSSGPRQIPTTHPAPKHICVADYSLRHKLSPDKSTEKETFCVGYNGDVLALRSSQPRITRNIQNVHHSTRI